MPWIVGNIFGQFFSNLFDCGNWNALAMDLEHMRGNFGWGNLHEHTQNLLLRGSTFLGVPSGGINFDWILGG